MMDLLASFFFSATVIACIKSKEKVSTANATQTFLKAATLSGLLLMAIYVGFSYVAANNSAFFQSVPQEALLSAVSQKVLGSRLGFVMGLAVALACLTTAITLVTVFADFIHKECLKEKVPYYACVTLTIMAAFAFSNLGFIGICNMIAPLLFVCYPSLITLTIINIVHKVYGFKPVKWPVYSVLGLSIALNFFLS